MCVRFNSCLRKSLFSCLVVLSASVFGSEYLEPPDEPVELSRRAEVNATSCGSGSSCSVLTLCRSGNAFPSTSVKILDNVPEDCAGNSIPFESSFPSHVSKNNGYIGNICNGTVQKNFISTNTKIGLSFWMFIPQSTTQNCDLFKIKRGNLEKQVKITDSGGSPILSITSNNAFQEPAKLKRNEAIHIFLRTEDSSNSSVFIDGTIHFGGSNTGLLENLDAISVNIGCELTILDFRFYNKYLTDREIQFEIYGGGNLSTMAISYPECRCPMTHPMLVRDTDDDPSGGVFCISRSNEKYRRLSDGSVDSLRDDFSSTAWTSSSSDNTPTVFFMFEQVFMIDNVSIAFGSNILDSVEIVLHAGDKKMNSKKFSSNLPNLLTWTLRMDQGPSENSTRREVEKMVADKIEIKMSKKPTTRVQIGEINIFGRCYCKGSSDSPCKIVGRNFNCTCESNRNVVGAGCEKCSSGLYRDRDNFNCSVPCNCDSKGTLMGKLNDCEADEGQCPCKTNVEGRPCNECKPLYFDLRPSDTNGCRRCNCGVGTKSCDVVTGSCTCKDNVESISSNCTSCIPLHYNVAGSECKPCECNPSGVFNSNLTCAEPNGSCSCKSKVMGRACDQCMDEYYNLIGDNSQGCSPCNCNKGGRLSKICDKGPKGVCTCRGNHTSENNRACDPVFLSNVLDPPFGPASGKTIVTVKGHLFQSSYNLTVGFSVEGSIYMPVLKRTDEEIQFQTPSHGVGPVTLKLRWSKAYERSVSVDFLKDFNFEYRPNPVVSEVQTIEAFASGGCKISIKGSNLNSVGKPKLIVYRNGTRVKTEDCAPVSSTEIHCNSPSGFSQGTQLRYGLELDGTTKYENYSMFDTNKIEIVIDPVPTREDGEVLEYKPVFKTEVAIEGQQYTSGCSSSDFKVIIRTSSANYSCPIKSLVTEMIKCEPDIDFPGVNEEEAMIMLFIGGRAYPIQRVKLHTFWNTWQFILIAVGGSLVILLAIFLPILICCCCRSRQPKTFDPNTNTEKAFTPLNPPELIQMETHQPRGRPNSYVGVQLETEHWDSFIHKINQSVRKLLNSSRVHKSEIVVGTRCIKKGTDIRIVNGNYATDTGKPNAGRPTMIKTLVNTYSSFDTDLLPDWINSGLQECLRLRDFCDDNVLQMQGVATDGDRFFILYPGYKRSLKDYLLDNSNTPTKANLLGMCVQLMEGVQFLHNNNIVHKDLAARNCVVDEDDIAKVSDAAFSWNLYPEEYMYDQRREKYLPVRWMAPESLTAGFYDTASDVWSFGVLIWEIMSLSMCLPYHDQREDEKIKDYIETGYRLGKPEHASDALYEGIMLCCWEHQGAQRPKLSEICDKFEQIQNPNGDFEQAIYFNGPVSDMDDGQTVYYNYGMDP